MLRRKKKKKKKKINDGVVEMNSEFIRPIGSASNWEENDWTKRLNVGIKKTFNVDTNCGEDFKEILLFSFS